MVGDKLADGKIGLVVDWGGDNPDDKTARSLPADLVAASPGDRWYLKTLVVDAHEPRPYVPSHPRHPPLRAWRSGRSGEQQGGRVARDGKFVIKQGRGGKSHFVLLASNGRIVVTSGPRVEAVVLKGIDAVKRLAADATVIEDAVAAARPRRSVRPGGGPPRAPSSSPHGD